MSKAYTVTICSSAAHYRQAIEIAEQLTQLGFIVHLPKTAGIMKETGNFNVDSYKPWYQDKADYYKKTELMKGHLKKIDVADAILVTNFEKNGIPGYIGGNALLEMFYAFLQKKPIYVYSEISDDLGIAEEVFGLEPIFINGDLSKIEEARR